MTKYKDKYKIESTRLKDFDYSQVGFYFFTICTYNRIKYFGEVKDNKLVISEIGNIVLQCWSDLPIYYSNIQLDYFVIMPNHIHGIIFIKDQVPNYSLSEYIKSLKSFSTRKINETRGTKQPKIWQDRFYDHVIRNDKSLFEIRKYIENNPLQWVNDEMYI